MSSRVQVRKPTAEGAGWQQEWVPPPGPEAWANSSQPARGDPGAPPGPEGLEAARQTGFREGQAAGRAEAQADMRPVLERLARSVEELAALRARLREEAEADLVRLAVAIARRVVRRELTLDPQAITGLVKAALEQLAGQEGIRLRVHPDHSAAVRACLDQAGRGGSIEIAADAALEPGSAIFETVRGDLDASAGTQLAEIEHGLTDRLRGKS